MDRTLASIGSDARPIGPVIHDWRWAFARGLISLVYGAFVLLSNFESLIAISVLFGVYLFIDGGLAFLIGWSTRQEFRPFWPVVFAGGIGLFSGAVAMIFPIAGLFTLVVLLSVWAMTTGILQIYAAFSERKNITGTLVIGVAGLLSISLGISVLISPAAGAVAVVTLTALYALFFGTTFLAWSAFLFSGRAAA